jgi:membrane protein implicated in regulation of membrane protease activity
MAHGRSKRSFILFNLATTAIEEAGLLLVLYGILPWFGINTHLWLAAVLVLAWAAWSYLTYRIGARTIDRMPILGAEALVGTRGITTTLLSPTGYLRTGSELWRAHSIAGDINIEVEVVIVAVKGLTLHVIPFQRLPPATDVAHLPIP